MFILFISAPEPKAVIMRCLWSVRRLSSLTFHICDFSETTERNLTKLDRKQVTMSSTKFVFFGPIGKTRWQPWPLIGWDNFNFSPETAEQNSTKLDRKQDLNVLYQVCVFTADRKKKMAALDPDWLRHFLLLFWNRWTEFNETWQEARSQRPIPSFVFFRPIGKTKWPPWPLIGWDILDFSSEQNSTKVEWEQDLNILHLICVFQADRKNKIIKMATPISHWLRRFDFFSETTERNSTKGK